MQRNMELVRMILLRTETTPFGGTAEELGIKSFSTDQIRYHAHIMMQDGLIEGNDVKHSGSNGPQAIPMNLTWKGHEFLDLIRDAERWNRAKAIIAKVGTAPISVWMKVLTDLAVQDVEAAESKGS
jgi:hypothetical protein